MTLAIRILPEEVRQVAAATIAGSPGTYIGIGTAIENPARIALFQNLTDESLMFSWDGLVDHFPLAANAFLLMDVTTNKTLEHGCFISQGQRFYVKTLGSPTTGSVYLTVFYGSNG